MRPLALLIAVLLAPACVTHRSERGKGATGGPIQDQPRPDGGSSDDSSGRMIITDVGCTPLLSQPSTRAYAVAVGTTIFWAFAGAAPAAGVGVGICDAQGIFTGKPGKSPARDPADQPAQPWVYGGKVYVPYMPVSGAAYVVRLSGVESGPAGWQAEVLTPALMGTIEGSAVDGDEVVIYALANGGPWTARMRADLSGEPTWAKAVFATPPAANVSVRRNAAGDAWQAIYAVSDGKPGLATAAHADGPWGAPRAVQITTFGQAGCTDYTELPMFALAADAELVLAMRCPGDDRPLVVRAPLP